jgi:hypothetical protein
VAYAAFLKQAIQQHNVKSTIAKAAKKEKLFFIIKL